MLSGCQNGCSLSVCLLLSTLSHDFCHISCMHLSAQVGILWSLSDEYSGPMNTHQDDRHLKQNFS